MEAIPIIGPVLGSVIGANATGKAADQQAQSAADSTAAQERMMDRNLEFQRWVYEQQRADNSQSRAVGDAARNQLAYRMGLDPASFNTPSLPYPSPSAPSQGVSSAPPSPESFFPPGAADGYGGQLPGGTGIKHQAPGAAGGSGGQLPGGPRDKHQASAPVAGGSEWNREFESRNNVPPQLKQNQEALTSYYQQLASNNPGQYRMPSSSPTPGQPSPPPSGQQSQAYTFDNQAQDRYGVAPASGVATATSSYDPNWIANRQAARTANPTTSTTSNPGNTNALAATAPGGTPTDNPGIYVDTNGNYAWSDTAGGTTPAGPAGDAVSSMRPDGTLGMINDRQDGRGMPRTDVNGNPVQPGGGGNALNGGTSPRYESNYDPSYDYDPNSMGGLNAAYGERAPDLVTQPYSSQPGALQAPNRVLKPFGEEDFRADPGYQFRLSEGNKGIERSAAAAGGQLSGATMKALAKFNQGTADQAYGDAYNRYNQDQGTVYNQENQNYTNAFNRYNLEQNNIYDQANNNYTNRFNRFNQNQNTQFNRLSSLSGGGQIANQANNTAAQNLGSNANSAFTNTGNQVSQNIIGAGNARSAGTIGGANAWSSGINNGINAYMQQNALNRSSGSGFGIDLFPDF